MFRLLERMVFASVILVLIIESTDYVCGESMEDPVNLCIHLTSASGTSVRYQWYMNINAPCSEPEGTEERADSTQTHVKSKHDDGLAERLLGPHSSCATLYSRQDVDPHLLSQLGVYFDPSADETSEGKEMSLHNLEYSTGYHLQLVCSQGSSKYITLRSNALNFTTTDSDDVINLHQPVLDKFRNGGVSSGSYLTAATSTPSPVPYYQENSEMRDVTLGLTCALFGIVTTSVAVYMLYGYYKHVTNTRQFMALNIRDPDGVMMNLQDY